MLFLAEIGGIAKPLIFIAKCFWFHRDAYVNAAPICFRSNPLHIWLTCGGFSGSAWSSWGYHRMTIYGAPCTQMS